MLRRMLWNWLLKESAVGRDIAWYNLGRPVFPDRNFETFAKEGYQRNVIAFRCIKLIAENAASVPWLLYTKDGDEIETHELLDVLRRPNPKESGKEFFMSVYAYDLLDGNSYLERVRVDGDQRIKEMYALRPDRMRIIPGQFGLPAAYRHTVNSREYDFESDPVTGESDILHVKEFNPLDDWYGQSPLEALGYSVDSHNEATKWNFSLLQKGARPSGALQYKTDSGESMDDDTYARLKKEQEEFHSGAGNAGRPMLLEGGLQWVATQLNMREMDWAKGKEVSASEIAIGYKVPEQLVGVPGQQTYNNYREARMALYEDAVLPLMDRFKEALTYWLQQMPAYQDLVVDYDEDQIPALAPRREAMWDRANSATFLTTDEKREAVGYSPYEPSEEPGGQILVPAGQIPLSDISLAFEETLNGDTEDENDEPQETEEDGTAEGGGDDDGVGEEERRSRRNGRSNLRGRVGDRSDSKVISMDERLKRAQELAYGKAA